METSKSEIIVSVQGVEKTYASGFKALESINLDIKKGEILALLGPNGAGKTTLISGICGIVNFTAGRVSVDGKDIVDDYRHTRFLIGLVPQELTTDAFESVWNTVSFSRGLFGHPPKPELIEKILKDLSLWDKKDAMIMMLSGGMKRRVLIAKALAHEPSVLFLDEPTAGVDVELRQDMWRLVSKLRDEGVTIVLTTHYIEEAEEMADRIAVINKGKIIVLKEKNDLMLELGKKQILLKLNASLNELPASLLNFDARLIDEGQAIEYNYSTKEEGSGINEFLDVVKAENLVVLDIEARQSSLEDIFVELVKEEA